MTENVETILFRIQQLESRVGDLEDRVNSHDVSFSDVKGDLKEIRQVVSSLRGDVLTTIAKHTNRTWKLIFVLVALVAVLIGVKELPKI